MEQPKKRHKTLIPLSKSHHQVLMLAQILRSDVPSFKGMPDSLREKIDYMKKEWSKVVLPLHRWEQQKLLPLLTDEGLAATSMREGLEQLYAPLDSYYQSCLQQDASEAHLDLLAHQLIAWVRFKERQLFQWMQANLSEDKLNKLTLA